MAKKEFTGVNLTTPICRLAFPNLFEPKAYVGPDGIAKGKPSYSVTMLFDKKTADLAKLKAAMVQAAKNEFGPNVDLKALDLKRIQDGDTKDRAEYKGQWVVRAKTTLAQPGIVDSKLQKILDPTEIYGGVYAHVNLTAKAFKTSDTNKGVTLYLNHVQKVKDGAPLNPGAAPESVFEALDLGEESVGAENVGQGEEGLFS